MRRRSHFIAKEGAMSLRRRPQFLAGHAGHATPIFFHAEGPYARIFDAIFRESHLFTGTRVPMATFSMFIGLSAMPRYCQPAF